MVGWANYMRTPHPDAVRRRISAHLTYDMDGRVEQHVDFDFAAHTQGIKKSEYAYARIQLAPVQAQQPEPHLHRPRVRGRRQTLLQLPTHAHRPA